MTAAIIIRDVFRQARASGLTAVLAALIAAAGAACLLWNFERIEPGSIPGAAVSVDAVARFHFVLAGIVADTAGVLLALVWTAGFLPTFLDPGAVSVIVAKPISRPWLFLSRWFGVVLYVAVFSMVFVFVTWMAIGLRTEVWTLNYWLSVPLLVAHFAVFYSFSALLAVASRNTTLCIVGSLAFWLLCWGMNYGRHALAGIRIQEATPGLGRLVEWGYWALPKPADFSLVLIDALGAEKFATPWVEFNAVRAAGFFHPSAAVLSSLAVGAVFLLLAVYEFVHDEY